MFKAVFGWQRLSYLTKMVFPGSLEPIQSPLGNLFIYFLLETTQIYINIKRKYKKKDEKSSNQRQLNYREIHIKQTNTH